jgi:hypothetical protein
MNDIRMAYLALPLVVATLAAMPTSAAAQRLPATASSFQPNSQSDVQFIQRGSAVLNTDTATTHAALAPLGTTNIGPAPVTLSWNFYVNGNGSTTLCTIWALNVATGNLYSPALTGFSTAGYQTFTMSVSIPAGAPAGLYSFNAYCDIAKVTGGVYSKIYLVQPI